MRGATATCAGSVSEVDDDSIPSDDRRVALSACAAGSPGACEGVDYVAASAEMYLGDAFVNPRGRRVRRT